MTARDKKTLIIGGVVIAVYLAFFYGPVGLKKLNQRRADYLKLVDEARHLKEQIQPYEAKAEDIKKLMELYKLDPAKLNRATVVAEASSAIQKAAANGVVLGPIREAPGRPSAKELATMSVEASGPVQPLMTFLHRLGTLGYPLVLDSVQINTGGAPGGRPGMGPMMGMPGGGGPPGMVKLSLVIIILDYEQWKKEEARHV